MDKLQIREREIFDSLKTLSNFDFVVIGGYAVNAYALPRFSIDCDIVVKQKEQSDKISKTLCKLGYTYKKSKRYEKNFIRLEKKILPGFKASFDIFNNEVYDRGTKANFSADWIFDNSKLISLKGKTVLENIEIKVINIDSLIVLKLISCRNTDIRDIFMLLPKAKNLVWIKKEVSSRYNFIDRYNKLKNCVISDQFKNNLQGVYGYIEENVFKKHIKAVLELENQDI